jgi:outer membrane protein OmpA-like peptidoglycan-associated protein
MRLFTWRRGVVVAGAAVALAHAGRAVADERWFVLAEAPAAIPLSEPQRDRFGVGALPAAAAGVPVLPWLVATARLRFGALSDGPPPADPTLRDPGLGGLGALTLGARVRPFLRARARWAAGAWLEAGAGPALTGRLARAALDAGLGWAIPSGPVTLGPVVRYVQVLEPDGGLDGRDARLLVLGVEVGFARRRPEPLPVAVAAAPPPPPGDADHDGIPDDADRCPTDPEDRDGFEDDDGCPDPDNDHDGILDRDDKCPNEREVVNGVEDQDGCPDQGLIEMVDRRIVLEDRVLFDLNRARVKSAATNVLQAIVTLWKQHPEWKKMVIEGHSDARGAEQYNTWLSEERASRVRQALIALGVPAERLETHGYGGTRPLVQGSSEEAHQRNRRVEFVVVDTQESAPAAAATAPVAPPPLEVKP